MILKLFGLPRTCTNLTKYMIEQYVKEDVTVWHHRPGFEDCLYHKHGAPRVTPGAGGYLLCSKPWPDWLKSIQARTPELSRKDALAIYDGWRESAFTFQEHTLTDGIVEVTSLGWETSPRGTLQAICDAFDLTLKPGHIRLPENRLSKGGDFVATTQTEEEWEKR